MACLEEGGWADFEEYQQDMINIAAHSAKIAVSEGFNDSYVNLMARFDIAAADFDLVLPRAVNSLEQFKFYKDVAPGGVRFRIG